MSLNTVKILGVSVTSTSASLVLSEIIDFVAKPTFVTPLLVFTPNPEFLVEARKDLSFRDLLNKADINLPDGVGLIWASKLLGAPIEQRISGADVVERLLQMANSLPTTAYRLQQETVDGKRKAISWTIGIAGARRGVLEESAELVKKLQEKYPNINFINLDEPKLSIINYQLSSRSAAKYKIQNTKYNVVLASHGMKEQEEWIWENENKTGKDKIKANVFMGIGGSLDFITGFSRRAPMWMRQIGLEWLWRGLQEPSHFKRIWKAVFVFGWMVIKEKFFISR